MLKELCSVKSKSEETIPLRLRTELSGFVKGEVYRLWQSCHFEGNRENI